MGVSVAGWIGLAVCFVASITAIVLAVTLKSKGDTVTSVVSPSDGQFRNLTVEQDLTAATGDFQVLSVADSAKVGSVTAKNVKVDSSARFSKLLVPSSLENPNPGDVLEVKSDGKLRFREPAPSVPHGPESSRESLVPNPSEGDLFFETDTKTLQVFIGNGIWRNVNSSYTVDLQPESQYYQIRRVETKDSGLNDQGIFYYFETSTDGGSTWASFVLDLNYVVCLNSERKAYLDKLGSATKENTKIMVSNLHEAKSDQKIETEVTLPEIDGSPDCVTTSFQFCGSSSYMTAAHHFVGDLENKNVSTHLQDGFFSISFDKGVTFSLVYVPLSLLTSGMEGRYANRWSAKTVAYSAFSGTLWVVMCLQYARGQVLAAVDDDQHELHPWVQAHGADTARLCLVSSSDRGLTWAYHADTLTGPVAGSEGSDYENNLAFSLNGQVVGLKNVLTTDGGRTWADLYQLDGVVSDHTDSASTTNILCTQDGKVITFLYADSGDLPARRRSYDGGSTWSAADVPEGVTVNEQRSAVGFLPDLTTLCFRDSPSVWVYPYSTQQKTFGQFKGFLTSDNNQKWRTAASTKLPIFTDGRSSYNGVDNTLVYTANKSLAWRALNWIRYDVKEFSNPGRYVYVVPKHRHRLRVSLLGGGGGGGGGGGCGYVYTRQEVEANTMFDTDSILVPSPNTPPTCNGEVSNSVAMQVIVAAENAVVQAAQLGKRDAGINEALSMVSFTIRSLSNVLGGVSYLLFSRKLTSIVKIVYHLWSDAAGHSQSMWYMEGVDYSEKLLLPYVNMAKVLGWAMVTKLDNTYRSPLLWAAGTKVDFNEGLLATVAMQPEVLIMSLIMWEMHRQTVADQPANIEVDWITNKAKAKFDFDEPSSGINFFAFWMAALLAVKHKFVRDSAQDYSSIGSVAAYSSTYGIGTYLSTAYSTLESTPSARNITSFNTLFRDQYRSNSPYFGYADVGDPSVDENCAGITACFFYLLAPRPLAVETYNTQLSAVNVLDGMAGHSFREYMADFFGATFADNTAADWKNMDVMHDIVRDNHRRGGNGGGGAGGEPAPTLHADRVFFIDVVPEETLFINVGAGGKGGSGGTLGAREANAPNGNDGEEGGVTSIMRASTEEVLVTCPGGRGGRGGFGGTATSWETVLGDYDPTLLLGGKGAFAEYYNHPGLDGRAGMDDTVIAAKDKYSDASVPTYLADYADYFPSLTRDPVGAVQAGEDAATALVDFPTYGFTRRDIFPQVYLGGTGGAAVAGADNIFGGSGSGGRGGMGVFDGWDGQDGQGGFVRLSANVS